uniref:SCP domain-containing protein n=2 Tax=Mesocestoides corti TaxID=53468 RepID=A0A5K3F0T2_MESCO
MMSVIVVVLAVILQVNAKIPSRTERNEIIAQLTKLREDVQPEASNMRLVKYSKRMERVAKSWVSQCKGETPYPSFYQLHPNTGFTLVNARSDPKFSDAFNNSKTRGSYSYELDSCKGSCFDYIQVMWARSTKVGCAIKFCKRLEINMIACAFNNAGKQLQPRGRPYRRGPSCSKCPSTYTCVHKQCSTKPSA